MIGATLTPWGRRRGVRDGQRQAAQRRKGGCDRSRPDTPLLHHPAAYATRSPRRRLMIRQRALGTARRAGDGKSGRLHEPFAPGTCSGRSRCRARRRGRGQSWAAWRGRRARRATSTSTPPSPPSWPTSAAAAGDGGGAVTFTGERSDPAQPLPHRRVDGAAGDGRGGRRRGDLAERTGEGQDVAIDLREAVYNVNPLLTPIMQVRLAIGAVAPGRSGGARASPSRRRSTATSTRRRSGSGIRSPSCRSAPGTAGS